MKVIPFFTLLILLITLSNNIFAQTKIIAHKSHSGKMSTFKTSSSDDNFGLPSNKIDSIIKISETEIIEVSIYGNREVFKLKEHAYFKDYSGSIADLKKQYPKIHFVDFDKRFPKEAAATKTK